METKFVQNRSEILKIVFFGPESTGKTTLAKALAKSFDTVWVEEFMRPYLQEKWNKYRKTCEWEDLIPIAEGQMQLENSLTEKANKVLFCDTNLLELYTYIKFYYNEKCPPLIEKFAEKNTYNFYFLTYIDVPWEADDLRDAPDNREEMFDRFHQELVSRNLPFVILKGDIKTRLQQAEKVVQSLLNENKDIM